MPLKWEVPGGAVDLEDETIRNSAARELWEEAGLVVRHFVRRIREVGEWKVEDEEGDCDSRVVFCE